MSGVNWLKRGMHWSRLGFRSITPEEVNARLIRLLCRLPEHAVQTGSNLEAIRSHRRQLQAMHLRLLEAVAMARHEQQRAAQRQATMADCRRQLRAMLKLDDAGLTRAIKNCDTATIAAINAAQSAIQMTPEARWVPSEDPDAAPGTQILAPENVRRSVGIALATIQSSKAKRGRKDKPYQHDLACACLAYWSASQPERAPGRLEFVRAVFEAADWRNDNGLPGLARDDSKNLERMLSHAARRLKCGRIN